MYAPSRTGPAWSAPSACSIREQLRIGIPVGVAIFAEVSLFTAIALFLAGYGEVVISAHTVALNFSSVLFMLPLSLGMALTVRIGQARGRGKYRHARFVAWNGVACALGVAVLIDAILIFGGPYAVALYTDEPAVQALAINLLLVAAIYQFSDAAQVSIAGALRGYKDTRIIMGVTVFAYWVVGTRHRLWARRRLARRVPRARRVRLLDRADRGPQRGRRTAGLAPASYRDARPAAADRTLITRDSTMAPHADRLGRILLVR